MSCLTLRLQRQEQRHQFFKRTRTGQPVMRHRIDKMLAALQAEAGGAS